MGERALQEHHGKKVVAISSWWAGIFAVLMAAFICSTAAYALSFPTDYAMLKESVKIITDANLDKRMTVMEEKMQAILDTNRATQRQQERMDDKIDRLLAK